MRVTGSHGASGALRFDTWRVFTSNIVYAATFIPFSGNSRQDTRSNAVWVGSNINMLSAPRFPSLPPGQAARVPRRSFAVTHASFVNTLCESDPGTDKIFVVLLRPSMLPVYQMRQKAPQKKRTRNDSFSRQFDFIVHTGFLLLVDVQRPRRRDSTRAFPLLPPVPHHLWYLRILPSGPRESEATEREATLPSLAQPISTKTTYQTRKTHNNIASRYGTLTTDGQRKNSKHVDCDKQKTYSDRTGDHPSTKQPATLRSTHHFAHLVCFHSVGLHARCSPGWADLTTTTHMHV